MQVSKAFTLIELLIVVAIIAILAAIAVPNFLEAQTRAKVSRALSDQRAVATALETYRIDANAYPLSVSLDDPSEPVITSSIEPIEGLLPYSLTSPVSYMSALPKDPFPAKAEDGENPAHSFHYLDRRTGEVRGEPSLLDDYMFALRGTRSGAGDFWMFTVGPDLEHDEDVFQSDARFATALYDATNGTVSNGDIYYFQGKGF